MKMESKFRTVKSRLKNICSNKSYRDVIQDAVNRSHIIAINCMQFIKLYVLYQYKQNNADNDPDIAEKYRGIPVIDSEFIMVVIGVITEKSGTGRPNKNNTKLIERLNSFYNGNFAVISPHIQKIKTSYLRQSLTYFSQLLEVNYTNNIVMHYVNHIKKYVRQCVTRKYKRENGKAYDYVITDSDRTNINPHVWKVYNDIINNEDTLKSDQKYHTWIKQIKSLLIPERENDVSIWEHLSDNPFKYLKHMITLNMLLEKMGVKLFQPLCLRSDLIPKYIKLDTQSLVQMLAEKEDLETICIENNIDLKFANKASIFSKHFKDIKNKNEKNLAKGNFRTSIWKHFFDFDKTKSNKGLLGGTKYQFSNSILTDGYGVSVLQVKKEHFGEGIFGRKCKKKKKKGEFKYLDELSDTEIKYVKEKCTIVGCDPGKVNLVQFAKESEDLKNPLKMSYTIAKQQHNTQIKSKTKTMNKMKKRQKCTINDKIKTVDEIEKENTEYNSKTCNIEKFKKYIRHKQAANKSLYKFYENMAFRKMRWDTKIKTQQSEDKLLNEIEKTFREKTENGESYKEIVIAYGDWNQKRHLRNFVPTKGIGLKRKIAKRFKIINTEEYMTSQTCHHCHHEKRAKKFIKRKNKNNQEYLIRGVLRCQNENCGIFWDRDINGALNILQNLTYQLNGVTNNPFIRPTSA